MVDIASKLKMRQVMDYLIYKELNALIGGKFLPLGSNLSQPSVRAFSLETVMKKCSKCQKELPVECFCKNKCRGDGRDVWCKICKAPSVANWTKNNKEKVRKNKYLLYKKHKAQDWMTFPLTQFSMSSKGYLRVYCPSYPISGKWGLVKYHRLVMARHLKRVLDKKELVHHIDGNRLNNGIENLQITTFAKHTHDHFQKKRLERAGL